MDMYRKVKSQKSKVKNKGGFTLLEVVVALAILSGVIVTALITLHYHISVTDRTMAIITATNLAKEKFEEIRISGAPALSEGDFAPHSPEFQWIYSTEDTAFRGIKKLRLAVFQKQREMVFIETYSIVK